MVRSGHLNTKESPHLFARHQMEPSSDPAAQNFWSPQSETRPHFCIPVVKHGLPTSQYRRKHRKELNLEALNVKVSASTDPLNPNFKEHALRAFRKQTNKQTSKQASKQASKQTNQTNTNTHTHTLTASTRTDRWNSYSHLHHKLHYKT